MLENLSEQVRLCLERAEEAKQRADEAQDLEARSDFLTIQRHWLLLAHSYQIGESVDILVHSRPERAVLHPFDSHALLRQSAGAIFAKDAESRMIIANPACLRIIGKPWADIHGRSDIEWHHDRVQAQAIVANDRLVIESEQAHEYEEPFDTPLGQRIILCTKAPLRDHDGQTVGIVGVAHDITEIKKLQERSEVVHRELNHRLKNSLALVQAIAWKTLSHDVALDQFQKRLVSYGRTQDLIFQRDGVPLHELIDTHRAAFNMAARVTVEGEHVVVSPHFAAQIGMALHELATNSVKYGAFGGDGHVEINWTMRVGNENRRSLILNWAEIHDRANAPGKHQGFGHLLLTQIVPANLNGTASLVGSAGKLRWTLRADVDG